MTLVLAGVALGAALEYAAGAPHATLGSFAATGIASTSQVRRERVATVNYPSSPPRAIATMSPEASGDDSHIAQIRRAHAAIQATVAGEQPPTF
jgi:hypothetical protein